MMKKIFTVLFCTLLTAMVSAAPGVLKGLVTDSKTNEGLGYVNVVIENAATKEYVKGTVTDKTGSFEINNLQSGTFLVRITMIGYTPAEKEFAISEAVSSVDLGTIPIAEDTQLLGEVTVVGQRSQMQFQLDKRIFNAGQDITSTGGSALDVLANIPSVEVNTEEEISLRGNIGVTVWINGRASGLSAENRSQILSQIPAASIDRVEIITNPSAKYNPEGTAGIINIIMKENTDIGYFGSIQGKTDTNGGYGFDANFNYNTGKLETSLSLSRRVDKSNLSGYSHRSNLDEQGREQSYLDMAAQGTENTSSYLGTLGITYHILPKIQLGFNSYGFLEIEKVPETYTYSGNMPGSFLSSTRHTHEEDDMKTGNLELNYRQKFNEKSDLDIAVARNSMDLKGSSIFNQSSVFPEEKQTTGYQYHDQDVTTNTWEIQADYMNELDESNKLEAGYKGDLFAYESGVNTLSGITASTATPNDDLFNIYNYYRDVHALYATYSRQINKFGFQTGLRGEYTKSEIQSFGFGEDATNTPIYKNKRFDLYPSIYLSYQLNRDEFQLNYSRRVSRPNWFHLNPFPDITDSTNIILGNPYLSPQYANSLELNYIRTWDNHMLTASLYYRDINNVIQQINYAEGNIMKSAFENVSNSVATGAELIVKNKLFRRIDLTTSLNLFYNRLDGFTYLPQDAKEPVTGEPLDGFAWASRITANTILPYDFVLQLTGNYNSRRVIAQGHMNPNGSFDAGLRKSFLDRKLHLTVTARNILNSRKTTNITSGTGFHQEYMRARSGFTLGVSLTYTFGNLKKSNNNSNAQFDYED
jgi:outer membrane receptor protein involved in Fe transport